jgi:hypothetical protein
MAGEGRWRMFSMPCKPGRILRLAVASLAALTITAVSAPLVGAQESGVSQSENTGCAKKLRASAPGTHACFRVSAPSIITPGVPFKVTFQIRARTNLRNVKVRIFNLSADAPKYALNEKYKFVKKGRVIKRSVTMTLPPGVVSESRGSTTRAGGTVQWGADEYYFVTIDLKVLDPAIE